MKIVFAHNVYNRLVTLKDTISVEKKLFPDSKISVAYNDMFINLFDEYTDIHFLKFNEKPHKIGCVNGCILSVKQLLDTDFDVLVFSHDDVYIDVNYLNIFNKNVDTILSGEYDVICRTPINADLGSDYYMMEVFYASKNAVTELFSKTNTISSENEIPLDKRGSISPEVWLYELMKNKGLKINEISFKNNVLNTYNELLGQQMGYHHKNAGFRGWKD